MPITPDFFPDEQLLQWLPGETLFSLLSRQHLLSGVPLASRTSERFFGRSRAGYQHDFPSHLASFVERTSGQLGGLRSVALDHTSLSFYRAFISSLECRQAIESMAGDNVAHLKLRLGILTSRFRAHHPLKACPTCMAEDMQLTGWAYWHMAHQHPGVWTCTKHSQPLLASKLKATGVRRFQWSLPRSIELDDAHSFTSSDALERFNRLSQLIGTMVDLGTDEPFSVSSFYLAYRNVMKSRGWLTMSGNLRMKVIIPEFLEFVRPLRCVDELKGLPQTSSEASDMLGRVLRPPRSGTHPLRHLVMIDWLFDDASMFQQAINEHQPADNPLRSAVAIRLEDPRKGELRRLLLDDMSSVRAAAKTLRIDTQTALLWAKQSGLAVSKRPQKLSDDVRLFVETALRRGTNKSDIQRQTGLSASTVNRLLLADPALHLAWSQARMDGARQEARSAWKALLDAGSDQGIKWMRSLEPRAYAWLYRNDRAWLDAHRPMALTNSQRVRKPAVDWDARDIKLSAEVSAVSLKWMTENNVRRIFFWQLYQAIPELKAKRSALHRLPLTRKAIDIALKAEPKGEGNLWGTD